MSISPCPMGALYEYLSCKEPYFNWNFEERDPKERENEIRTYADWAISYCSDDPTEWIPVLDKNVKKSIPKARKIIEDRLKAADGEKLNEKDFRLPQEDHDKLVQEYRSLKDKEIPSYVLGTYMLVPAMGGSRDYTNIESCAILFERLEISGEIEDDVQGRFFGQYEWYFHLP